MEDNEYMVTCRYIDDAEIVRAENEPRVMLARATGPIFIMWGIVSIVFILCIFEYMGNRKSQDENMTRVGFAYEMIDQDYRQVKARLEKMGFTDITLIDLDDTTMFSLRKRGKIESISIGGRTHFSKWKWFNLTDPVIISYH